VCEEQEEFKEFRSSGVQEFRSSGVQEGTDHKVARRKRHFREVDYWNDPAMCSMLLNF